MPSSSATSGYSTSSTASLTSMCRWVAGWWVGAPRAAAWGLPGGTPAPRSWLPAGVCYLSGFIFCEDRQMSQSYHPYPHSSCCSTGGLNSQEALQLMGAGLGVPTGPVWHPVRLF